MVIIQLPLFLKMLKTLILTQTDNHTEVQKKVLHLKKVHSFKKWLLSFETLNSTYYAK